MPWGQGGAGLGTAELAGWWVWTGLLSKEGVQSVLTKEGTRGPRRKGAQHVSRAK